MDKPMAQPRTEWRCPSCKRVVPGKVDTCRCGGKRPAFVYTPPEEIDEPASPARSLATMVGVVLLAGLGMYWWHNHRGRASAGSDPVKKEASGTLLRSLHPRDATQPTSAPAIPPLADPPLKPPDPEPVPPKAVVANAGGIPATLEAMIAASTPAVVLIETALTPGNRVFVRPDRLISTTPPFRGGTCGKPPVSDGETGIADVSAGP